MAGPEPDSHLSGVSKSHLVWQHASPVMPEPVPGTPGPSNAQRTLIVRGGPRPAAWLCLQLHQALFKLIFDPVWFRQFG